jgi:UDP-N-acetylglucosamine diphosphorylase / glucose-1-phosphate thymidylyltransferase / UDP-N-acetylgalactosamine diphosphorylase / glucosamine-1-phosphate N-acetyltransferase / galactosamine-1-phosphate N-acetyltransferase
MSNFSDTCAPLSSTREIVDFPIGNRPLKEHQRLALEAAGLESMLKIHPHAWLEASDLRQLSDTHRPTLVDANGKPVAWIGDQPDQTAVLQAAESFVIEYPWDLLRANERWVSAMTQNQVEGEVHPSAVIEGILHLGKGTRILPGVFIEGNVVIGENCKIGPNCYLRGNTSIGDSCHIGQSVEIKNCLILSKTHVGHLSYVGDSVLGESVNFGAGTTVSNLRHDGKNHQSMVDGELRDTGRRKFGTIVGDGVHTGIHTSIYPGRKLWPKTSTRPGEIVQRDILKS